MKRIKKLTIFFIIFTLSLITIYGGIYLYAWMSPKLAINSAKSFYYYDIYDNLITGDDEWISYENIDKDIINATIAIEDRHFFSHQGFDYLRIAKALYTNINTIFGSSTSIDIKVSLGNAIKDTEAHQVPAATCLWYRHRGIHPAEGRYEPADGYRAQRHLVGVGRYLMGLCAAGQCGAWHPLASAVAYGRCQSFAP